MNNNYAIIMAGGIGSRFWPWSTKQQPKQFLDVLGTGKTLLQQTFERINRICPKENILIITNAKYATVIAEQVPDLPDKNIVSEPRGKNTAPCIAYGAFKIKKRNPAAKILVAPSDHIILKEGLFIDVVKKGFEFAKNNDALLTIGIEPHKPETGYGYIQSSGQIIEKNDDKWYLTKVLAFKEKPDRQRALQFLANGDYYWNAGIVIWSAGSILKAFENHLPAMYSHFLKHEPELNGPNEKKAIEKVFNACESISIDYGVMEKATNVYVLSTDIGWSDLGSWSALHEMSDKDPQDNSANNKRTLLYNSRNCHIHTENDKIAVVEGLEDYIVVQEGKALLVCRKENEQMIKQFVKDAGEKFGEDFV